MQKRNIRCSTLSSFFSKVLLTCLAFSLCIICTTNTTAIADSKDSTPPQRIVVFPLFAEEMLLEMVGPDRIVYLGHEYYENGETYSPTMELTKDIKGRYWNMSNEEVILALNPDLIILEKEFLFDCEEIFPELYQANIPFLFLDTPETIEDIRNVLTSLGGEVGAQVQAAQMIENMEAGLTQIAEIASGIHEENRARAFHYVYHTNDYKSKEEEASTSFYKQSTFIMMAHAAGVIAVGPDSENWVDGEPIDWLLETNPDIITFDYAHYDTDGSIYDLTGQYHDAFINDLLTNPKLSNITAIKNRVIYPICLFESQFIVESAEELARLAYPELFPEN